MKTSFAIVAAFAATVGFSTPALADFNQFMNLTCGTSCKDPVGERSSTTTNWSAFGDMGTRDFIGSTVDGSTIDASGILAAARIVGATEVDRWLRSGQSSSLEVSDAIMGAISSFGGIDLSGIVGKQFSTASVGNGTDATNALLNFASLDRGSMGFGPGGGGAASCDAAIDADINASAKGYIEGVVAASESENYGFSQVGGQAVSGNSRSESGLFGGSCLDIFMTGDKDMLFRPPQLSQLVDQLSSMFGAEAAGSCTGMPTVHEQVASGMPNSAFQPGRGGFFPSEPYASDESGESLVNRSTKNGMAGIGVFKRDRSNENIFASIF